MAKLLEDVVREVQSEPSIKPTLKKYLANQPEEQKMRYGTLYQSSCSCCRSED